MEKEDRFIHPFFIFGTTITQSSTCSCVGSFMGFFMVTTMYTSGSDCSSGGYMCNGHVYSDGQAAYFASMDADDCTTIQAVSSCAPKYNQQ